MVGQWLLLWYGFIRLEALSLDLFLSPMVES